jgi:hypothetical protein
MAAFQPKGDKSLKVIVTDLAKNTEYDELLTFPALARAIGVEDDEHGRAQVRGVVSAARPVLLSDHSKALVADRGKGYRVAKPGEFAGIATDYRERASRSLEWAQKVIKNAPTGDMTPAERKRHQAVGIVIDNVQRRMTSAEKRLDDIEQVLGLRKPRRTVIQGEAEEV